jgi:hypothetical protein
MHDGSRSMSLGVSTIITMVSKVCAGALIFLGLLDASLNYHNGIYMLPTVDMVFNGFINL